MDGETRRPPVRHITPVQYPGNDREYIVDQLFWGEDDSHWERLPGPGCEHVERTQGYARTYAWRATAAGATFAWRGRIEADLVGIERLRVRAQAAASMRVTLRAEIDGRWVTVVEGQPGNDDYGEYTGTVHGRRLSGVEVVFAAGEVGPVLSSIMWVMVVRAGDPTPVAIPDSAWTGLLSDAPARATATPLVGVFFDAAELDALRRQLHAPECAAAWANHVAQAEAFARVKPETTANPVIPHYRGRYGRPDAPASSPLAEVANLAFVGLIERRNDLRQSAARWALTWSRCERWVQYGVENLRGMPISHGRFAQAAVTTIVAQVLDWCGEVLTDAGQQELARAIHDLGIVDIDGIMGPGSYVWRMNQGVVFECGRFLGAMAVRPWYPNEFPKRLDDAQHMLQSCLSTAFHDDGAGTEGSAYWNYTMALAVPLIDALARSTGRSAVDITPPNAVASARWAWCNRRTDSDTVRFLPHADSDYDRGIDPLVAAFLASPLQQAEWEAEARMSYQMTDGSAPGRACTDPLYLRFMRDIVTRTPQSVPAVPALSVFPKAGQVDVRPATPQGGMRIYFLSGPRTGHCHDDKNSFMLEAYGQMLLLDRGTPSYTHPATAVCKTTEAHNAIAPDGLSQSVAAGQGGAVLLRAEEMEDGRAVIESDASGCWPGLSRCALRRLTHSRPDVLVVEDEVEWTRPMSTWQCWQSSAEWRRHEDGWMISVNGVELLLTATGDGRVDMEAAPFSLDGLLRPVHRLVIRTARETRSLLRTVLRVRRAGDAWKPVPGALCPGR